MQKLQYVNINESLSENKRRNKNSEHFVNVNLVIFKHGVLKSIIVIDYPKEINPANII